MAGTISVHECLFCPQTFGNAADKDDHVLEHFSRETCAECNQNMIRIGGKLFIQHNDVTCINSTCSTAKVETGEEDSVPQVSAIHEQEIEYYNTNVDQSPPHVKEEIFVHDEAINLKEENIYDVMKLPAENEQFCIEQIKDEQMDEIEERTNEVQTVHQSDSSKGNRPECDICGNSFFDMYTLRRHKAVMHGDLAYRCTLCKAVFRTEKGLEGHRAKCLKDESNISTGNLTLYECDYCHKICLKKCNLLEHMKRLHIPDALHCKTCTAVFTNKYDLKKHTCCKNKIKQIQCEICLKYFAQKFISDHKLKHIAPEQLKCPVCGTTFTERRTMMTHMKVQHDPSIRKDKCEYCWKIFFGQDRLEKHLSRCKYKEDYDQKQMNGELQTIGRIPCEICGLWMKRISIRKHMKVVHKQPNEAHTGQSSERNITQAAESHEYECDYCHKKCKKKSNLREHLKRVHNPNASHCKTCTKVFASKAELKKHACIMDKMQRIQCDICLKYFPKKTFKNHRLIHTGPREFPCSVCDSVLSGKRPLELHMKMKHDPNIEKIRCEFCKKIYFGQDRLLRHQSSCKLKILHDQVQIGDGQQTDETHSGLAVRSSEHKCGICHKIYKKKCILTEHIKRMHMKKDLCFMCATCGKRFDSKPYLKIHERIHTGVRPFKCTFEGCDMDFALSSARQRHLYTHSDEKRFHCTIDGCDKKFASATAFSDHKKKKHGVQSGRKNVQDIEPQNI